MLKKFSVLALAIFLGAASVLAQDNSSPAANQTRTLSSGQKYKIQGVVVARDNDSFVVRDAGGTDTKVILATNSSVKTKGGVFGGLFGTPIINQPQVAILCVGTIEKRPKVLTTPDGDDYIAIRQMAYFALTYDHRIVDGADAEKFLSFMKEYLETTQFSL